MKKFWLVLTFEYARQVFRKRFLFGLMSVPAIILVMVAVVWITMLTETNARPAGFVDHSGFLANSTPAITEPPDRQIEFIPYQDEAAAMAALKSGQIQVYYVLDADYQTTGHVQRVSIRQPSNLAETEFKNLLRASLLAGLPDPVSQRLTEGNHSVIRSVEGDRQLDEENWINILIPFFTGLVLMIAIFASSGYLMQAVVDEKQNRTIEILVTSLSPTQLISAKALAMIGLGLTQVIVWIGFGLLVLGIGMRGKLFSQAIQISPWSLAPVLLVFIPAFVTIAGLMILCGSTVADEREGQQISGLITLPAVLPYALAVPLMTNPDSPLALALSFFPLTAPVTVTMRMAFNPLPPGQLVLIVGVLSLWALAMILLAGRAFRLNLLGYGKRLSLRLLFRRTRPVKVTS